MTPRSFRFAVVAAQADSAAAWTGLARQVEGLGYSTLLVPDTIHTLSPAVACAVAATATDALRVGPYVLSAANRTPAQVGYETATLRILTDGRYEVGVGAGRPGADRDAAALGMPFGTPAERISAVRATVAAVRDRSPDTPVLVAGSGPRMLAVAGRIADTVALGLSPEAGEGELARAVATVRDAAGPRFGQVELSLNLLCVGDRLPPGMERFVRVDPVALLAAGSVSVLAGSVEEMVDTLGRRRDEFGISYVCTSSAFAEAMAPVVQRLAGT